MLVALRRVRTKKGAVRGATSKIRDRFKTNTQELGPRLGWKRLKLKRLAGTRSASGLLASCKHCFCFPAAFGFRLWNVERAAHGGGRTSYPAGVVIMYPVVPGVTAFFIRRCTAQAQALNFKLFK